jgi:hypothetical protein
MSPSVIKAVNRAMVDSMASVFAGSEERLPRSPPGLPNVSAGPLMYGFRIRYYIDPELAAFANSSMAFG